MYNSGGEEFVALFGILLLILVFGVLYFLPTIIVVCNKQHNNKVGVIIVNFLLGWSFLGWVISLVWSFQKSAPAQVQVSLNANHNSFQQPHSVGSFSQQPQSQTRVVSPPSLVTPCTWQGFLYRDGALQRQFPVSTRSLIIGRSNDADIQIDDGQVSGRHWQIQATDNGVELKDLNSSNGTWKHGQTRTEWDLAQEGDWYQVGSVQLGFRRV
ncbi:MAG: superinfection immunity protein [Syntrophotaleaceae bacterium]